MSLVHLDLSLPRHAFAPGETARAGDIWRLLQEAAVLGSSALGWPPGRYAEANAAFVVRTMTVAHPRPVVFGDALRAETWVSTLRREMFTTREIRVIGPHGRVAEASQAWVHVSTPELKPCRACPALVEALRVVEREPSIALPEAPATEGPAHTFSFDTWFTWMDPLAHANHPAYVDWVDEALSRRMSEHGLDPHTLRPVAETLTFRSGVVAPERVTVHTRLVATSGDRAWVDARIEADGRLCAEGRFVRDGVLAALR